MLLDSNAIFFDSIDVAGDTTKTSHAVGLTSLFRPGQEEPICVTVRFSDDACVDSVRFLLKESDKENGEYKYVDGTAMDLDKKENGFLAAGKEISWRWLPRTVTKPWLKMEMTLDNATKGKIFAAVVREDYLEYEDGMYIDKGRRMC